MPTNAPVLLAIVGLVALVIVVIATIVSRYSVATPSQAFVVTGRKNKGGGDLSGQKVITGGGVFVVPFVQQKSVMDLSSQKIAVRVEGAISKQGIKLAVDAVAMVKVGGDEDSIRLAAQRFPGNTAQLIAGSTTEVLSGILRSIIGTLTVEEIMRDRQKFASEVASETEAALTVQGLVLDTFQIQDVTDDGTYLRDLGRPEAARVAQEAAIAEADARRTTEQRRLAAEQDILDANREFALKQAEISAQTEAAKATAAAAGPLAAAAKEQEVLTAQELVAQRQAALKDRQLDTEIRKPADAARYQVEQEAEAARQTAILQGQAESERQRLSGEGEKARRTALADASLVEAQKAADATAARGKGERDNRAALAEATRLEGEAQAAAALAVGTAEAEAMDKKAAAFKNYGQAAMTQMLVEVLPKVAHELAAPMAAIDNMTVISNDGASALPKAVSNNMAQLQQILKDTVGLDLHGLLSTFTADNNGSSKQSTLNGGDKVTVESEITSS